MGVNEHAREPNGIKSTGCIPKKDLTLQKLRYLIRKFVRVTVFFSEIIATFAI